MRKLRLGHLNTAQIQSQQQRSEEWVTMGVIVEKTQCKKSSNGNDYMVWRISDLTELNAISVKVLLFGDCVHHYWKLQAGNTILLNNPQCAEQQTNENEVTLKLSKVGQVIELGFCPDLGRCQGHKAADGDQCSNFVNVSHSLYCRFHIQQRVRQVAANRGTLNQSDNLPPKKVRQGATANWKNSAEEQPPPGLITMNPAKSAEKGKMFTKPIPMLQRGLKRSSMESLELEMKNQKIEKLIAENPFNLGSKNLRIMRRHKESHDPKAQAASPSPSASQQSVRSMREFIQSQASSSTISSKPPDSAKRRIRQSDLIEQAKIKKAAKILKDSKEGNNVKRQKSSQNGMENDKSGQESSPAGRGTLLGVSFTAEQIQALLAKKSAHEEEAVQEQLSRQNAYFDRRHLEEQVETNATNLMEIKGCKVVTCKECDYTSANQSAYCRLQGHQVKRHNADKRFFKCMDCQRRTISYERMPTKPCLGCKLTRFCRVAMRDERKVLLPTEQLKIREEEKNFSTTAEND